jgi:gamma-glutamylcyclotransferase (GGCT)/AIG2-like uncharacterized protein YtfP
MPAREIPPRGALDLPSAPQNNIAAANLLASGDIMHDAAQDLIESEARLMSPFLPLFVFGTLRHDQGNHHYLHQHYDRWIPATLTGYTRVAELMIDRSPAGEVRGELYFLIRDQYDQTLAGCDELEELPPGQLIGHEYERRAVIVQTDEGTYTAWAYVKPDAEL